MDFLKWFLESSIFGTILGFCLGKFGSVWDENKKKKEEGGGNCFVICCKRFQIIDLNVKL